MGENAPFDMCAQQRLELACASAQFDQGFPCPHEETLHPWLSKIMHLGKTLIGQREYAG